MKSYVKHKDICQGKRLTYQKIQGKKLFYNYLYKGLLKRRHRCIKSSNCFFKRRSRVV